VSLYFGTNPDSKYGKTVDLIPENAVDIIERGFSIQDRIRELC
jgi:hypothetical protein